MSQQVALPWFGVSEVSVCSWLASGVQLVDRTHLKPDGIIIEIEESTIPLVSPVITAYFRRGAAATSSVYQAKISLPSNPGTYFIHIDHLPDYVAQYVSPVFFPLYNKDQQWSAKIVGNDTYIEPASVQELVEETCEDVRDALHEFPQELRLGAFLQHNKYCDIGPVSRAKNRNATRPRPWEMVSTTVSESHNVTEAMDRCVELHHSDYGVLSYCTSANAAAAAADHTSTTTFVNPRDYTGTAYTQEYTEPTFEELLTSTATDFDTSTEDTNSTYPPLNFVFKPNLLPNENVLDDALYLFLLAGPPYVQGSQLLSICDSKKSMQVVVYTSYQVVLSNSTSSSTETATPPPSSLGPSADAVEVGMAKPMIYYEAPLSGFDEDKYFERVALRSRNYRLLFPYSSWNGTLTSSVADSDKDMLTIQSTSSVCSCFLIKSMESVSGFTMAATLDLPKNLFSSDSIRLRRTTTGSGSGGGGYEIVYGANHQGLSEIDNLCTPDLLPVKIPYLCVAFERYFVPPSSMVWDSDFSEDCTANFPVSGSVCAQQPPSPFNDNTFSKACIPLLPSVPYDDGFSSELDNARQEGVSEEKLSALWLQLRTSDSPSVEYPTIDGATVRLELPPTWEINPGFIAAQWTLLQRPLCNDTAVPEFSDSSIDNATGAVVRSLMDGGQPRPQMNQGIQIDPERRQLQESENATLQFEIGAGRDCRSSGCNGRGDCRGGKMYAAWLRYHCRCNAEYGGASCEFTPNYNPQAKISFLTYSNVVGFLAPVYILVLIAGISYKQRAKRPSKSKSGRKCNTRLCIWGRRKSMKPFVASTSHGHGLQNVAAPVVSDLRLSKPVRYRAARRMDDTSTVVFLLLVSLLLTAASIISAIYHQCDTHKSCPGVYVDSPYLYYTERYQQDASDWRIVLQYDSINYTRIDQPGGFTYSPVAYSNGTSLVSHHLGVWSSFTAEEEVLSVGRRMYGSLPAATKNEFLHRRLLLDTSTSLSTAEYDGQQYPWWSRFFLGIWIGENIKIQFMRWQVNDFWSAFSSMGAITVVIAQVPFVMSCILLFYAVSATVFVFHFLPSTAALTSLICLAVYLSILVPRVLAWYVFSKRIRSPRSKLRKVLVLSVEAGMAAFLSEMFPRAVAVNDDQPSFIVSIDTVSSSGVWNDNAAAGGGKHSSGLGIDEHHTISSSVSEVKPAALKSKVATKTHDKRKHHCSKLLYYMWRIGLQMRLGTVGNFQAPWALFVALFLTVCALVFWYLSSAGTAYWFFHSFWHMTVFGTTIFFLWAVYGNPFSPPMTRVPGEVKYIRIR